MQDDVPDPAALCVPNGDDDVRLLRRLDVREGETGVGGRVDTFIGVAVDCETTGIGDEDAIIELALRRFRVDPAGVSPRAVRIPDPLTTSMAGRS